jgi:tetratricopeptide (TPR) repeat protein
MEGDNNFFPIVYERIVERMREDILLFDRQDIIFKMPYLGEIEGHYYGNWEGFRALLEKNLIEKMEAIGIYYAVFDPDSISLSAGYALAPNGMLHQVVKKEELINPYKVKNLWRFYSTESFYGSFERDYLNRQISAHFLFRQGQYFFMAGKPKQGIEYLRKASQIGYNDSGIHSAMANFFTHRGFFEEARLELEKSLVYHTDLSVVRNNWGVYHYERGAYEEAIKSFQEAIKLRPRRFRYHKNLGYAMFKSGRRKQAVMAFEASLAIYGNQPEIDVFMRENGLK